MFCNPLLCEKSIYLRPVHLNLISDGGLELSSKMFSQIFKNYLKVICVADKTLLAFALYIDKFNLVEIETTRLTFMSALPIK